MYNEDILNYKLQELNGKPCGETEYFILIVLKTDNKFNPIFWCRLSLCNHVYIIIYAHGEGNPYIRRYGIF